ncbi:MAG: alpha/beta hydrolase [Phototrophicales bacterium]|nr:alpha/beta hydrolase [Phototrophicales bacterium]
MRIVKVVLLALLCLAVVPVIAQTDAFEPTACPLEELNAPAGIIDGEQIRCGLVTVPLYHNNPDAGTIQVAVAIIPSINPNPASDPLVVVQGGPGGSGFTFFPRSILGTQFFIGDRDVIVLEQRGTKYSQPDLICEESFAFTREYLDDDIPQDEAYALSETVALDCAERLRSEGIDLAAFNSLENAADIPAVVAALGYSEFNFYGVSYGTMLGQHLLNLNPDGLRSVILDANVPLSQNFIPLTGVNATRVFGLLFESCATDETCNTVYPDLETKFFDVVARLNETPIMVTITDPNDQTEYEALLKGDTLISLMFSSLYSVALIQAMPHYITQMYENNNYGWIEVWGGQLALQTDFARGFYNSVMCAEDADFTEADFNTDAMYPEFIPVFVTDTVKFVDLCAKLGIPALDSAIADLTSTSDVPVFIASGNFDPITPPAGGDVIAESLPNAYHFVYPNGAHGALLAGSCPVEMMSAFLNNPTEAPDDSCIAGLAMNFLLYHADGSGLFNVAIPNGLENISPEEYTHFYDPTTDANIYLVGVVADDVDTAITNAIAVIDPEFAGTPAQVQEIEIAGAQWINEFYLLDPSKGSLRLTLSRIESTDGVYAIMIIDVPSQGVLTQALSVLEPLIIGLEFNPVTP